MFRIFGRNQDRPLPSEYEVEAERVLGAVTYNPLEGLPHLVSYQRNYADGTSWYPYDSVFQETAFEGQYPDIFDFLCKTNDKAVFSE